RRLEGRLLEGQARQQVAREAGAPPARAQEVGVGGEALAAHAEVADLPGGHQHRHRGPAAAREGEHRAERLDAPYELRVPHREGPAGAGVGPGDREARALEVHRAEAGHVRDLLAHLEQERLRRIDAGPRGEALDLLHEVRRRVADHRSERERPAARGLGSELGPLRALTVDQLEVGADRGPEGLAVPAADLTMGTVESMMREGGDHAAASGQISGITRSSTETMRSISARVSTSGGASTRVLPRCRPPPERPTITPSSWQRSVIRLIWACGMTAFEARSVTSSTPA